MVKVLLFDFARTLLFPKDVSYSGELNALHRTLAQKPDYDFIQNFELNEKLMTFLATLSQKYRLCIFTSGTIQNAPAIKDKVDALFEKIFSAEEMMVSKNEPESYLKIVNILKLKPEEVLFIDDLEVNILAARSVGLKTFQFKDNRSLIDFIGLLE